MPTVTAPALDYDRSERGDCVRGPRSNAWYPMRPEISRALYRYVFQYLETGAFLRAALENDFAGVMVHADYSWEADALRHLAQFIGNEIPIAANGSHERVEAWLAEGRKIREAIAQQSAPAPEVAIA